MFLVLLLSTVAQATTRGDGVKTLVLHCTMATNQNVKRLSSVCIAGGGFTSKRGTFGTTGKLETMMSVSYGRIEDLVFSGAATGDIYIWKDTLLLKTVKAHDGPVFAMHALDKVFVV